jgi:hypothetical protein
MIYLYPEKHTHLLDLDALVKRAGTGEIFLLMEDGVVATLLQAPNVDALEPVVMMSPDTMLACMAMMTDTTHETIGAMPLTEGYVLYAMMVYILASDEECSCESLDLVAAALRNLKVESLPELYKMVKTISDELLGGVPSSIPVKDLRLFVEGAIARRTGMSVNQHLAYYNFVGREKTMAESISRVQEAFPGVDVHVVLGACHVTGNFDDEMINSLNVNALSYKDLCAIIEEHYPKQRLCDLIGEHAVK